MPDPTREEMVEALRFELDYLEGRETIKPRVAPTYSREHHVECMRAILRELEAGGWRPPILVGRLRADRSTYYICPERPGFHFITGEGESTDALLKAYREFCVLYDAANSAPPATSDGGEG